MGSRTTKTRVDRVRVGDFYMEAHVNGYASGQRGTVTSVVQTAWLATLSMGIYDVHLHTGAVLSVSGDTACWVER